MKKRVFKLKTFARWAKKLLNDEQLCAAAKEIMKGQYEANLGKGLCKKRIAMSGQGKSGSIRTLVAIESSVAIFSLPAAKRAMRVMTLAMQTSLKPNCLGKPCKQPTHKNLINW